jgi:hypothetical protein
MLRQACERRTMRKVFVTFQPEPPAREPEALYNESAKKRGIERNQHLIGSNYER